MVLRGELSRHNDQSCNMPDPNEKPLRYKKLVFLFALLALGIFISLFIALFIFWVSHCNWPCAKELASK